MPGPRRPLLDLGPPPEEPPRAHRRHPRGELAAHSYWLEGAADVAEIPYQPFGKKRTYRMIVRRVAPTPGTQLWLKGVAYSHYAFITDREGDMLELEADHPQHAVVENVIRDSKYGLGLNHIPSGKFGANAAWLALNVIAHNLCRVRREALRFFGRRCKTSAAGLSQQSGEAEGSLTREVPGGVGAALTKSGRVGTTGRPGPGEQDGKVQRRVNQAIESPQGLSQLKPGGYGLVSSACTSEGRSNSIEGYGSQNGGQREGLRRTCGEAAGEKLGASPVDRSEANTGTVWPRPSMPTDEWDGGQAHRRLMGSRQGGAAVVVRGRESRLHGEGRQRVRSRAAGMPGVRW